MTQRQITELLCNIEKKIARAEHLTDKISKNLAAKSKKAA
ncbi:Uncharacterised protein [Escherichia coli]|nr:hypothetical protein BANRA_00376 [Escherichia coli]VDL24319.1 hypothetical protein BANRA_02049 [Escherichia coli]VVY08308.1 Uncharacterised protein [Escherichia coli]VVY08496.1 Uncharacterised protein [Escherichia coli]VVY72251.1 Uncharacterised protein [Escherichia coli]